MKPTTDGTGSTEPTEVMGAQGSFVDPTDPEAGYAATVIVTDLDGKPITTAKTTLDGTNFTADDGGQILVTGLKVGEPKDALITADGYLSAIVTLDQASAGQDGLTVKLAALKRQVTFTASAGGAVDLGSYKITFPAGGLKKADGSSYDGEVKVGAYDLELPKDLFDATTKELREDFDLESLPIGDVVLRETDGSESPALPIAMVDVTLKTPTGDALDLKAGSTAKLSMPIPAGIPDLTLTAGTELQTWALSESKGVWEPLGTCKIALDGGNARCEGDVPHFSRIAIHKKLAYRCVKISKIRMRIPGDKSIAWRAQNFQFGNGKYLYKPKASASYLENGIMGGCAVGTHPYGRLAMALQLGEKSLAAANPGPDYGKELVLVSSAWKTATEVTAKKSELKKNLCTTVCGTVPVEELYVDLTDPATKPATDAGPAKCTDGLANTCIKLTLQPASGSTDGFTMDYKSEDAKCGSSLMCRICSTPDAKAATAYACMDLTVEKGKQASGTLQNRKNPQDYAIYHCVPPTEGTACLDTRLPKP